MKAWKERGRQLKIETYALYLAYRDPRVPWWAKIFAACVAAYAFSPIDLIPDPIPLLGYLDDLVLVPLGVMLARRMIPPTIMAECRERARTIAERPSNWYAAGVIVLLWFVLAGVAITWLIKLFR